MKDATQWPIWKTVYIALLVFGSMRLVMNDPAAAAAAFALAACARIELYIKEQQP
jgi:hypothetical protein